MLAFMPILQHFSFPIGQLAVDSVHRLFSFPHVQGDQA
jgi:hypothetical protein